MDINKIKNKKLISYKLEKNNNDNTHIFEFENGYKLLFSHENNEGDVEIEKNSKGETELFDFYRGKTK